MSRSRGSKGRRLAESTYEGEMRSRPMLPGSEIRDETKSSSFLERLEDREAEADLISRTKNSSQVEGTINTDQPNYSQAGSKFRTRMVLARNSYIGRGISR